MLISRIVRDAVVVPLKVSCKLTGSVLIKRHLHGPKKFYKNVTITESNGLFEINLDGRKMKTPLGKVFQVPSETLAIAVATEWETQDKHIERQSMHLTGLCNTAQDNPLVRTKETLSDVISGFLETDTICCRQDEPLELADLQHNEWDPVLKWFRQRYNIEMDSSSSINGPVVSNETKEILVRHLLSRNFWELTGLHYVVEVLKSVILALGVIDRHLSAEKAVSLSRLELEFQISRWGNVEWAHDLDLMDLRSRVSAAILFTHCTSFMSVLKQKKIQ